MNGLELFEYTGDEIRVQTWVLPKGQERFARELLAERAVAS